MEYKKNWVQVEILGNGDYTVSPIKGHDNPNILFDLILHAAHIEVILAAGQNKYEVFGDDYGLNPLRWFTVDSNGRYKIKIYHEKARCNDCLDPWCLMKNDKSGDVIKICSDLKNKKTNETDRQLRFMAYKKIARAKYGQLPEGVRRKLGICCELFVRTQFPANAGKPYGEFERKI